jgi:hypothetical protein
MMSVYKILKVEFTVGVAIILNKQTNKQVKRTTQTPQNPKFGTLEFRTPQIRVLQSHLSIIATGQESDRLLSPCIKICQFLSQEFLNIYV